MSKDTGPSDLSMTILVRKVRAVDRFRLDSKKVGGPGRILAALERKLLTEDTKREEN